MTAEVRMRERAARVLDEEKAFWLDSANATGALMNCKRRIRALPLEGERGEPAPAREPSAVEELDYLARVQEPCDFNGQAYKHAEELDRLRTELEGARNSANYWKAEHLAGNLEIDRLREQLKGGVVVPRESGSLELGDSPHLLAFMVELHSHLPEGKRPYGWADFSDEQRTRIKRAYDAMLAAAKETTHG